jgi:signal transduction histidine kinase
MKISLEQFVNSTNCSMAMFNRNMNYLAISENFLKHLNLTRSIIGDNFKENLFFYNSEQLDKIHQHLLSGESYAENKYLSPRNDETDCLFHCTWTPWHNINKSIGGFLLTLKNKRSSKINSLDLEVTRAAAKRQLEELENIYINAPVGLCFIDNSLRFVRVNKQFADLFKLSIENVIGNYIIDTLPSISSNFIRICNNIQISNRIEIRKDISYDLDLHLENKRYFNEIWYPTKDVHGDVSGIGLVIQEITNIKHIEMLQTVDNRKNVFLATLSHELRNPLSAIRSALYLLENQDTSDENIRKQNKLALDIASERTEHMVQLINGLLDISRINEGKIELILSHFDLIEILHKVSNDIKTSFIQKKQKIEIIIPKEGIIIRGDYLRIMQIFTNIFENACKYTQPGGTIKLEVYAEKSQVIVLIEDNGIGIEPENLENIFETFSQIKTMGQPSISGIGIGLSLCRNLVNLHNGHIKAHSAGLGQGSKFIVTIPLCSNINAPTTQFTNSNEM